MPQMDGIALAQAVKDAGLRTRILMLSTFGRAGYLSRAMKAGAAGYVLKDAPAEALADAIRTVHAGGRAISAELAVQSWQSDDPLNDRERQILKLAGAGLTSSAIGKRLNLSDGTIRNYLSEAISKMGAANRIEAALIAAERGWL